MTLPVSVPSIRNTCGEYEQELRSRKCNVIEAFATMAYCLVVLWFIQYPFGVLMKNDTVVNFATGLLWLGAMYLLLISPRLHKDTLTSWGLGNPVALWRTVTRGEGSARYVTAIAALCVIAGLTCTGYIQWDGVAKFLFGMKREAALQMKSTAGGATLVFAICLGLATFLATCAIRYDNFLSALWAVLKVLLVLGPMLYALAYAEMGTRAFADFNAPKFAMDVFGYIFWGALQQMLFCSYFGTRLRKGFAPAANPADVWKRRFLVALLNGAFFGIIHINSWMLVLVCWILGIILSWLFMQDRNRNLIALGFIHGFLGSSVGWLFAKEKAGGFHISMGVGPTHLHTFDPITMVLVIALVAGCAAASVYVYRTWREE